MGAPVRYTWILVAALLVACGDDNPDPPPVVNNTLPDADTNNTVTDMGDDTMVDMTEPPPECDAVQDLGVISEDQTTTIALVDDFGDIDQPACVVDEISAGARVVKFRVNQPTYMQITATAMPKLVDNAPIPPAAAIELRTGHCGPTQATGCSREPVRSMTVLPDTDYFLNIAGDTFSSGVRLKFEVSEAVCTQADNGCVDGVISKCAEDGSILRESKCVDACLATGCTGDTCDSVIDVVAASGTTTLSGNRSAYSDSWSAENRPLCNLSSGGGAGPTLGPDFVVKLPNVPAGATIYASAENPMSDGVYGFFFLDACNAERCLYASSFDANGDNAAQYTTQSEGDIFLRVESLGDSERFFAIDVTVTQ